MTSLLPGCSRRQERANFMHILLFLNQGRLMAAIIRELLEGMEQYVRMHTFILIVLAQKERVGPPMSERQVWGLARGWYFNG